MNYEDLKRKIEEKSSVIGIIGMGYVGLPMASLFASRGYRVKGADINKKLVKKINAGTSPINETGLKEIIKEGVGEGRLTATTDVDGVVKESDVIVIVVQTPINEENRPNLTAFKSACNTVAGSISKGKLVLVESTVPPGTMENMVVPILEKSKLKAGDDFFLVYSPERAIPTRTLEEIQTNSRVIGGINEESSKLARILYSSITTGELMTTNLGTAEMVKIIENTYRDVNIALANEIAMLCERLGVDAIEAINMANKHPRVNLHLPGPGVGGHCIPKDPYFLIGKAEELGMELKIISSAREINENMPSHLLGLIERSLKKVNKDLKTSKVSILGIAYKGNTDDTRGTPSEEVIKSLMKMDADVVSHDPFVSQDFGGKFSNSLEEVIEDSDCVVILTDHDLYKKMDLKSFASLMNKPSVVIDSRRILKPEAVERAGAMYSGIGR
ncbi:MAG: nucleotide sugar dehydrogenase [Candidatus Hydrothermarchaeales archaeon]